MHDEAILVRDTAGLHRLQGTAITAPASLLAADAHSANDRTTGRGRRRAAAPRGDPRAAHKRWLQLWVPHLQRQWLAKVISDDTDSTTGASPPGASAATGLPPDVMRPRLVPSPPLATDDFDAEEPRPDSPSVADATQDAHTPAAERNPTTDAILRAYWAPRFRAPQIDLRLAAAFTRVFIPSVDASGWHIPRPSDVEGALRAAKDSAPGPDGIPYSGWRHTGRPGLDLAAGKPPMRSLLAAVGAFLPKGSSAEDVPGSGARTRRAADTRPLALKNTSSKTTAAILNRPLRCRSGCRPSNKASCEAEAPSDMSWDSTRPPAARRP